MEIKRIPTGESAPAFALVERVFMQFEAPDYSEEGVKTFRDTVLRSEDFQRSLALYGAYENGALTGVGATRRAGVHIALLFVDAASHRRGAGRRLVEAMLADSPTGTLTVNSSPYAVEFYHRLGFVDTAPEQTTDGLRFTPMLREAGADPI